MGEPRKGPKAQFDAFLAEGRFMLQRSVRTGEFIFYPRLFFPGDASDELEWVPASGRGVVYATTIIRRRNEQGGDYNVVLIDLAEGPRLMATVMGIAPEDVRIGLPVQSRIVERNGAAVLIFDALLQEVQ